MGTTAQYRWEFSNVRGQFAGYLDAVDPRDAVSRVMTQKVPFTDRLFGEKYGVCPSVIDAAPGNIGVLNYEATTPEYSLRVRRLY